VVLQFIQNYKFTHDDIEYIRTVLPPTVKEEFFTEFLAALDCSDVHVYARRDGSVALPSTPLLRIEGPLCIVQLLETTLLNLVGFASLIATNAARCRLAAGPTLMLVEYGLRRAQGPDGGMHASKYAYLGGFDGTSNMLAGFYFGVPVKGTHAHSFVQSFASFDDVSRDVALCSADGTITVRGEDFCERARAIRETLLAEEELLSCNDGELAAFVSYALAYVRLRSTRCESFGASSLNCHL
jgi:nicotinate phosphoribosyltransferase